MGPVWKKEIYGTPEGDTVKYSLDDVKEGSIVFSSKWNELKDLIIKERKRRNLDSNGIFSAVQKQKIVASGRNNLNNFANIENDKTKNVDIKDVIQIEDIDEILKNLNKSGSYCTCNCDYCTCNCNYCICNCDYACTCNCAYCTCDCNYCTCNCNYGCTCNCNY